MNKTVTINLANILFHIDEGAYTKMERYLAAVKNSFSKTSGSEEILADIEARIAELLNEKMKDDRQVVTEKEVDEIIGIMGQPEDYMVDEDIFEDEPKATRAPQANKKVKKLYRDTEHKFVAGVSTGLAHYFGIDPLWIRILWVVFTIGSTGGFILIYGLLWVLIPEASSTAQKLDMRGEAINISSIERKVKEGFDDVADRVKSVDYEKMGDTVKKGSRTIFDSIADIIMFLFKIFGKLIGILLIIIGGATLIGLFIGLLTAGILGMVQVPGIDFYHLINSTGLPIWVVSLLAFFAIGIPFFFLLYLGLKILVGNLKSIGNIAKFSLLGLWLLAIILLIVFGIREAASHAYSGSTKTETSLAIANPADTLQLNLITSGHNRDKLMHMGNMIIAHDDDGNKLLVSEDVRFTIKKAKDSTFSLETLKEANGASYAAAKQTAERITYDYAILGNNLELNNYLSTSGDNKFHDQQVRVNLMIPVGTILKYNPNNARSWVMRADTDRDYDNLSAHIWRMSPNGQLTCLDCSEQSIPKNNDNRININENGIDININEDGENGKIRINENGIDIDLKDRKDSFKMKINEDGIKINTDTDANESLL